MRKKLHQILIMLFLTGTVAAIPGCSGTNNRKNPAMVQKQESDSMVPKPKPGHTAPGTGEMSIFERLASDMVKVETDSGSFHICRYEVTQRLWKEVTGDNPSQMRGDDLPVEQVNYDQCQAFIAKLNELTGKSYRLPTEAEWEYACRGGKESRGYIYSGSDDIDEVAWYDGNSEGRTHPAGQKMPNELGLYDMSGNVWDETPGGFWINSLGLRLAL